MTPPRTIRIGCGAGSWGDDVGASRMLLEHAELDYLVLDYLAEVTLSIMRRQMDHHPSSGYATDFLTVLGDVLPFVTARGTKIVTNAGGLNPQACASAISALLEQAGLAGEVKVAVVDGDDLMPSLNDIAGQADLGNIDDGRSFDLVRGRVVSANAYLGAGPIRDALDLGADIVVTGRCVDMALALGPLMHEFGWATTNYDLLAVGAVAGHLLECGAQSTGGNHHDWENVRGLENLSYPIVEVGADGSLVLTKAADLGGVVNTRTTTEQLLHEIFDPKAVLSPDVSVDWTTIQLTDLGGDRVAISSVKGSPPPDTLKVSIIYQDGYRVILTWPYAWPAADKKAAATLRNIEHTVARLGLDIEASRSDVFGTGAILGDRVAVLANKVAEPLEVFARYAARTNSRQDAERLASLQAPMHYGPAGLAGSLAGGKGQLAPIYTHWPTLVPSALITKNVRIV